MWGLTKPAVASALGPWLAGRRRAGVICGVLISIEQPIHPCASYQGLRRRALLNRLVASKSALLEYRLLAHCPIVSSVRSQQAAYAGTRAVAALGRETNAKDYVGSECPSSGRLRERSERVVRGRNSGRNHHGTATEEPGDDRADSVRNGERTEAARYYSETSLWALVMSIASSTSGPVSALTDSQRQGSRAGRTPLCSASCRVGDVFAFSGHPRGESSIVRALRRVDP
jgi:hypothetical protein